MAIAKLALLSVTLLSIQVSGQLHYDLQSLLHSIAKATGLSNPVDAILPGLSNNTATNTTSNPVAQIVEGVLNEVLPSNNSSSTPSTLIGLLTGGGDQCSAPHGSTTTQKSTIKQHVEEAAKVLTDTVDTVASKLKECINKTANDSSSLLETIDSMKSPG